MFENFHDLCLARPARRSKMMFELLSDTLRRDIGLPRLDRADVQLSRQLNAIVGLM